ncbi:orange carotenoid protein N-terminal domain-containing protein [Leptolyngbya sp. FACHB-261]|uniref:orange carotenoid protein N-terminal domain-containing protein n=1 Tax=Leptolyngbya sp. FACHB-261 TaxID=2692806 RepID=UPI001687E16F|nr:orange carotenoid protein N-terminal domain-containing protein [Leptolyngbya sp. FACHB-261]MBD2104035.1 Orange carotenoid protein [Leptolyngbya sp. FACHB-261]
MTFAGDDTVKQQAQAFQNLEVDEQLALFWFIYTEMGKSITPAAPGASTVSTSVAESLFEQVKGMSHEEQLQVQRDLINRADTLIGREYGSMSATTKLLFWYLLSQGMDNGTIIPMPADYKLSSQAEDLLNHIKALDFAQQITTFRDYVEPMGAEPKAGAEI